jgi:hypothetical protein
MKLNKNESPSLKKLSFRTRITAYYIHGFSIILCLWRFIFSLWGVREGEREEKGGIMKVLFTDMPVNMVGIGQDSNISLHALKQLFLGGERLRWESYYIA